MQIIAHWALGIKGMTPSYYVIGNMLPNMHTI